MILAPEVNAYISWLQSDFLFVSNQNSAPIGMYLSLVMWIGWDHVRIPTMVQHDQVYPLKVLHRYQIGRRCRLPSNGNCIWIDANTGL